MAHEGSIYVCALQRYHLQLFRLRRNARLDALLRVLSDTEIFHQEGLRVSLYFRPRKKLVKLKNIAIDHLHIRIILMVVCTLNTVSISGQVMAMPVTATTPTMVR